MGFIYHVLHCYHRYSTLYYNAIPGLINSLHYYSFVLPELAAPHPISPSQTLILTSPKDSLEVLALHVVVEVGHVHAFAPRSPRDIATRGTSAWRPWTVSILERPRTLPFIVRSSPTRVMVFARQMVVVSAQTYVYFVQTSIHSTFSKSSLEERRAQRQMRHPKMAADSKWMPASAPEVTDNNPPTRENLLSRTICIYDEPNRSVLFSAKQIYTLD